MRPFDRLFLLEVASVVLIGAAVITSLVPIRSASESAVREAAPQKVNPHAEAVADFQQRVEDYLNLQQKVAGELPPMEETDDPVKIKTRERALGTAIARARPGAEPGAIFGPELRDFFVRTIRRNWRQRAPEDREAIERDLPRLPSLDVNDNYPSSQPLATFPPAMLRELPRLPDGLEYRLYGDHLILRDVKANLVVDLLPNVLPGESDVPSSAS